MEIVCDEADVGAIIAIANGFGVHARRVGRTERSRHKRALTIRLGLRPATVARSRSCARRARLRRPDRAA
jgi:hypothetical protein